MKRDKSIGLRVRPPERAELEAAAARRGEWLSEYVRERALEAARADRGERTSAAPSAAGAA